MPQPLRSGHVIRAVRAPVSMEWSCYLQLAQKGIQLTSCIEQKSRAAFAIMAFQKLNMQNQSVLLSQIFVPDKRHSRQVNFRRVLLRNCCLAPHQCEIGLSVALFFYSKFQKRNKYEILTSLPVFCEQNIQLSRNSNVI